MDIFAERREEVVDDAAAAGFDLGGDGHAGVIGSSRPSTCNVVILQHVMGVSRLG